MRHSLPAKRTSKSSRPANAHLQTLVTLCEPKRMNSTLTFALEPSKDKNDDFGWLTAITKTPQFSAQNGMWVQWQDLVEFGLTLGRYPITASEPIACEWGYGEFGEYTLVTRVEITPVGLTGALVVNVNLANFHEPANRCQTQFRTNYGSVATFKDQIAQLMRGEATTAILSGDQAHVC
jgi:hypothetical protein